MKTLVLAFFSWCLLGQAVGQTTPPDMLAYLKSISFPLYRTDDPKEPIRCIGWNGVAPKNGTVSFAVTAAHCDGLLARNQNGQTFARLPMRFVVWALGYDQHIFLKPNCGDRYARGFSEAILSDEVYYTLGHRTSEDSFENLALVKLRFVKTDPDDGLWFERICTGDECQVNLLPGVSGAPVINARQEVVGSYYGFSAFAPEKPKVSPIDMVAVFLRAAASSDVKIKGTHYCQ